MLSQRYKMDLYIFFYSKEQKCMAFTRFSQLSWLKPHDGVIL